MAQIEILVKKQLLTIQNTEIISSGDSNFDSCIFSFDETWDGFTKTGVFYQDKASVQYAVLSADNTCMIPAAAMTKAGRMYIGVFGIKDTAVVTSTLGIIDIKEGAISGGTISTEPTDDVFLAIIAQYQHIVELMEKYTEMAADIGSGYEEFINNVNKTIEEQNAFLETLGAFELEPLENKMSAMELTLSGYGNVIQGEHQILDEKLKEIEDSAFLIQNVQVVFDENNEFILNDERITETSIANAYFDVISVESAIGHGIYIETFDGYIRISTTTVFNGELNCTIEIRRY